MAIAEVVRMAILGSLEDEDRKRLMYGDDNMPSAAQDLGQYLAGEFRKGAPYQIVARECDRVGRRISDREVSRLEVVSAMRSLRHRQRRILEKLYVDDVPAEQAAADLDISTSTLYRERREALKSMADVIYDWAKGRNS
jgi:DNA-directed RNA polymerase specialized sigma24 family protein